MVTSTELILSGIKLVTVVLGLTVIYLGWKAYRTGRRKPILWLTVAMVIMTLGAISEGLAYQGLGWTIELSHVFEAIVTLIAFAVLVYSLYV